MPRKLSRRIERLEELAGIAPTPPPIVFFYFTYPPNHAKSDGHEWYRQADEAPANFEARIVSDPAFANRRRSYVVWGCAA